jgi:regulator of protease activity HflC (stomatin/prohibitin superfamily)
MMIGNVHVPFRTGLVGGVVALLALSVALGSWYTVDQTERAVLLRNGAFVGVQQPGLHFKLPWLESVVHIGIYQRTTHWDASSGNDFRQEAYTYDQQPATLSLTVIWHIPEGQVDDLYRQYRSEEGVQANLISRRVPQDVKTVVGTYTAVSAIQDRAKLNADVLKAVTSDPDIAKAPIVIDGVQIEDIQLSKAYIDSVEAAMQARVEVQRLEQQEQQQKVQADITVIKAKAQADARVAQANAEATATRVRGEAEAAAIHAKGDALRANPELVDLIRAERWNGVLPTTVLPNGTLPFLDATKKTTPPQ